MRKVLSVVVLLGVLFVSSSWAAEKETNVTQEKGTETAAGQSIANLDMADRLIELGRQQQSPMLLASAAQLLRDAGAPSDTKREKTDEAIPAPEQKTDASTGGEAAEPTAEWLYAEAIALAKDKGDAALAGILENQSKLSATRGVPGGAIRHYDRVRAHTRDIYTVTFRGGERAWARAYGNGKPTALYIYDENGNFITSDTDWHTQSTVSWNPKWTGPFKVVVENRIGEAFNYTLRTN